MIFLFSADFDDDEDDDDDAVVGVVEVVEEGVVATILGFSSTTSRNSNDCKTRLLPRKPSLPKKINHHNMQK